MRAYSSTPELALITALNTWVSSVLYNQWFHADVHAGNLLILKVRLGLRLRLRLRVMVTVRVSSP